VRIDVSELLVDTDLGASTFVRARPTNTLGYEGETSTTYAQTNILGIVQPAATTDANLLPEGVRIADVNAFFSSTGLSAGGPSQMPDLLKWGGYTYRVLHVQDFSPHGMQRALAQRIHIGALAT